VSPAGGRGASAAIIELSGIDVQVCKANRAASAKEKTMRRRSRWSILKQRSRKIKTPWQDKIQ